jgi:hypothetical protein
VELTIGGSGHSHESTPEASKRHNLATLRDRLACPVLGASGQVLSFLPFADHYTA